MMDRLNAMSLPDELFEINTIPDRFVTLTRGDEVRRGIPYFDLTRDDEEDEVELIDLTGSSDEEDEDMTMEECGMERYTSDEEEEESEDDEDSDIEVVPAADAAPRQPVRRRLFEEEEEIVFPPFPRRSTRIQNRQQ
jgi:hypothetical protein